MTQAGPTISATVTPPRPASRRMNASLLMIATVFLAGLLLRLICLTELHASPLSDMLIGDGLVYDAWARQIASGDWIGKEVFYQAPLYPYFLAVVYSVLGHGLLGVKVIQAIIGGGSCALLAAAGKRMFNSRVGWIAGLLLAVYPSAIFFDLSIQKSVFDTFFICAALLLISMITSSSIEPAPHPVGSAGRGWNWFALGVTLGLLMLTRENALVLVGVVLVWLGLGTVRKWSGFSVPWIATLLAGLALVLLPVVIRNYRVGGEFHLSTSQMGPNLYMGNHAGASGTYEPLIAGRGNALYERTDAHDLAQAALNRPLSPAEVSNYWRDQALRFAREQPGAWLALTGHKAMLLMNSIEMVDTEDQYAAAEYSLILRATGLIFHFGVLFPLSIAGLVLVGLRLPKMGVVIAMAVVYGTSVIAFYVVARYRLPLVPFLILFLSAGIGRIIEAVREDEEVPAPRMAVALVLGLAAAFVSNWPITDMLQMRAIGISNIGSYFAVEKQDHATAVRFYERAVKMSPRFGSAHSKYAVSLFKLGKVDQAMEEHAAAVTLSPNDPLVHYNAAVSLYDSHNIAEAMKQLEISQGLDASSAPVENELGLCLVAQGKIPDAIVCYQRAVELDPQFAQAWNNLGSALARQGKLEQAASAFSKAVELNPGDLDARFNLGNALLFLKRYAAAAEQFKAYLVASPGDKLAIRKLVEAMDNLKAAQTEK